MSTFSGEPVAKTLPRPARISGWKRWVMLLTVPYLGGLLMLAWMQRSLIYHPYPAKALPAQMAALSPDRVHDVVTQTEDNLELRGWLVLPPGRSAKSEDDLKEQLAQDRPLTLYFGGNAANRSYRLLEIETLGESGSDVLIFDYRGYGDSSGEPTEEGLAHDSRAAWKFATVTLNVEPTRIVLYGESLGGGVATRLAQECCQKKTPPAGLILRSTFNSLTAAASYHFSWLPVRWLLIDRFPSDERIRDVTCPVLQFHGRRDTIVPLSLGQKLFAAAPDAAENGQPKRFVELLRADHNDVIETSRREVMGELLEFFRPIKTKK
ncbi:MAG: alpha/beta hydrolase [Planctomycetia bacterium]|nr:alpha/beta hydrolase [Planctomycetia bacterium]